MLVFARGLLKPLLTHVYFPGEPQNEADPLLSGLTDTERAALVGQAREDVVHRRRSLVADLADRAGHGHAGTQHADDHVDGIREQFHELAIGRVLLALEQEPWGKNDAAYAAECRYPARKMQTHSRASLWPTSRRERTTLRSQWPSRRSTRQITGRVGAE